MRFGKLIWLILSVTVVLPISIFASGNKYDVDKIPPSLLGEADAVIRNYTTRFEIDDESSAEEKVTFVVTIFDQNGQDYGRLALPYDKFVEIDDLDGKILDSKGKDIRNLDDDDVKDYSNISSYSLYEDSRIKVAQLYYDKYPYTIEYTYKISYDGYLNWPTWYSRHTLDPVQLSRFEVKVPDNYNLRYWCSKELAVPKISIDGNLYTWEATNLKSLSYDAAGEDIENIATVVRIAPSNFNIDGYEGNMDTWKNFGLWYYKLCKGKYKLPAGAVKDIKSIISPNDNTEQKVIKLYKYLQSHTRYVSVELGIGDWQPFDASYVYNHGYGDCKALSNYMISLLKEEGITAYPVLIHAGVNMHPLVVNFPSNQFNHVIVYVPLKNDSLWLECTSQTELPGEVDWDIENREALMVTSHGGVLVKVPKSKPKQNTQIKDIKVTLSENNAVVTGIIKWNGNQRLSARSMMHETPEKQRKWIWGSFKTPDTKLKKYSFESRNDSSGQIYLNINLSLPNYVSLSGKRIFFNPNLMDRRTTVSPKVEKRLSPIRFSYPHLDVDSVTYTIPSEYKIEAFPDEVNLSSSFGNFESKVTPLSETKILYVRSLQIKKYSIPAKNYEEYRKFFSNVVEADRAQVVLVKKD